MIWFTLATALATPPTFDVALSGSGFDAYEGQTVHAVIVNAAGQTVQRGQSAIAAGSFDLTWTAAVAAEWGLAWWVDLGGDGRCDASDPAYLTVLEETYADVAIAVNATSAEGDRNPYACDVVGGS